MIAIITFDFYINLKKLFINIFINTIIFINFHLKYIILSEVTVYEKFETIDFLINLFDEY